MLCPFSAEEICTLSLEGRGCSPAPSVVPAKSLPLARSGTGIPLYPRVCGGTINIVVFDCHKPGLSPRVRGNLPAARAADGSLGSIPACAGEPRCLCKLWSLLAVYPRVCGGTGDMHAPKVAYQGLSPRVRGNPRMLVIPRRTLGSIPACAGEPRTTGRNPVYPQNLNGARQSTNGHFSLQPIARSSSTDQGHYRNRKGTS